MIELAECPVCHRGPELFWHHTPRQTPQGVTLVHPTKFHKDAKAVYGCERCGIYTKPAFNAVDASRAWNRQHFDGRRP